MGAGTGAFEVGNLEGLFVGTLVGRWVGVWWDMLWGYLWAHASMAKGRRKFQIGEE
jgi:hypothetical protein